MIYENYEAKGGEEFLSDVLFRVCSRHHFWFLTIVLISSV
jgi:hypothetical protein